ncbi:hypothetical protein GGF31_007526 [Allomyces arbusculus]|nr:hypothetical protein GGF31_007526 [Allomyces arbusculus]
MGRTARAKAKPKAKAPIPATPVAAAVDAVAEQVEHVEHAADQPDYSLFNVRLASFSNSINPWPHATPTPEMLAAAGFYHDPFPDESLDSVNCFQCGKPLGDWDPDDDPYKEHVGHTTDCAWARAVCLPEMCRLQGPNPYDLNDPETWPAALERAREETFVGRWPHAGQKGFFATIKRMAKAGFHYTPEVPGDDCASCIYCGTTLSEWSPKDNPLIEHKNRQPDCPFFDRIAKVRGKRPASTATPAAAPPPKRPRKPPASRTAPPAASVVEDEPVPAARPGRKPTARSVRRTTKALPPEPVDLVPDDEVDAPPIAPASATVQDQKPVSFAGDAVPAGADSHPPPVEGAFASGAANSAVELPPPPPKVRTLRRGRTATRTLRARRASRSATTSTGAELAEVPAPKSALVADQPSHILAPVADEPVAMDVDESVLPPPPPAEPEPQPDPAPVVTRTTRRGTRTVAVSTRSSRRGRGRGRGRGGTRTVPARAVAVVEEEEPGPAPDVDAAAVLPADEPGHAFAAPRAVVDVAMDVNCADPLDYPAAFAPDPAPRPGQVQSRSPTSTRTSAPSARHPATPHPRVSAPATPTPVTPHSAVARPTQVLTPPAALPVTPSPAPHAAAAPSATPAARDAAALDQPDHVVHREPTPPPPPRAASPPPLESPARPKRAATKRRAPARTAPPRDTRHRRALYLPPAAIVPKPVEESALEPPAVPVLEPVVESPIAPILDSRPATGSPALDPRAHTPSPVVRRQSSRSASEQLTRDALVPPPAVVSPVLRRPSQRRASHAVDTAVAERVNEERDHAEAAASGIDEASHEPAQEQVDGDSAMAKLEEPIHDVVEDPALDAEDLLAENVEEPARDATPVPASRRTSRQSALRASPIIDYESRRSSMLLWHTTPQSRTGRTPPALSMVDDDVELHVVEMDSAANDASASSTPTRRRSSRIQACASKSPVIDVTGDSVDEDGLAEPFEELRRAEAFREPAGSSSLSAVPQSSSLSSLRSSSVDADRVSTVDDTPEEETPMDVDDEEDVEEEVFPDPDDMLPVTPALPRFVTPARARGQHGGFSALRFQVDPTTTADTPTRPTRAAARRASTPAVATTKSALGTQARTTPALSRRASTPAPARQPAAEPSAETDVESATYAGPAFSTRRKTRLFSPSAAPPPSHAPPPPPTPVQRGARRHRSHTAPAPVSVARSVMLRYRVVEIEIPIYVRRGVRTPQQTPVPTPEPRVQELVETDREDAVKEEADGMDSGDEARVEVEEPERAAEPLDDEERESDEGEEREGSEEEDAVEERVRVEVPEGEAEEEREAAEEMNVAEERDTAEDAGEGTAAAVGRRDGFFATKDLDMDDAASEPDLVLFLEDEPDASFHGENRPLPDHQDVAINEPEEPQELDEMAELDEMDELIDENDQDGELQAMADLHIADDLDTADELDADHALDPADVDPMHVATPSISPVQIEDDADVAPPSASPMQIEDELPAPLMSPIHIEDEDGHPLSLMASSSTPTPTPTPFAPHGLSPAASMYESSSPTPTPTASRPSTRTGHASPAWHSSPTPSRRRPGSLSRTVPTAPVSPSPALRVPDQDEPTVILNNGSASFDEDETAVADKDEPSVADADLPAVQLPSFEPQDAVVANGLDHDGDIVMDEAAYADMVDPYAEARAAIATMEPTIPAKLARAARACDPAERKLTVREWLAVVAERRKQAYRAQVQKMIDDLYRKAREAGIDLDLPLQ